MKYPITRLVKWLKRTKEKRHNKVRALFYKILLICVEVYAMAMLEEYHIDTFVIGNDWEGKFDFLKEQCEVVYLERTPEISTTKIKEDINKN